MTVTALLFDIDGNNCLLLPMMLLLLLRRWSDGIADLLMNLIFRLLLRCGTQIQRCSCGSSGDRSIVTATARSGTLRPRRRIGYHLEATDVNFVIKINQTPVESRAMSMRHLQALLAVCYCRVPQSIDVDHRVFARRVQDRPARWLSAFWLSAIAATSCSFL